MPMYRIMQPAYVFNLLHNKLIFTFFGVALLSASCIGPKKINKWVDDQYGSSAGYTPKIKNDYISIASPLLSGDVQPSQTTKQTKNMLPLLFYWQFDYINTCTLNPRIPFNTFSSTVQSYAGAKGLKQKLNGQKIEFTVEKIPNVFALKDRAHIVWIVYAFGWDNVAFQPESREMTVSYKILNNGSVTKAGSITVPNMDATVQLKYLQSLKRATSDYLYQYDESIKQMTKKAVDKLLEEI